MIQLKFVLTFFFLALNSCFATQQSKLGVLLHPSYQQYDYASGQLKLSELNSLILAAAGYSIGKPIEWNGLTSTNSLQSPRVTLVFVADKKNFDVSSISPKTISIDQDADVDFKQLISTISLSNGVGKLFDNVPTSSDLRDISNNDCDKDTQVYVIRQTETDVNAVTEQINSIIGNLSLNCAAIADQKNDLTVYFLNADLSSEKNRAKRQAPLPPIASPAVLNTAIFYSDQYPAIFNLLFWTSLILALTIGAIAYGMCSMDPGLNTVIYRMTSQRIKKDQ